MLETDFLPRDRWASTKEACDALGITRQTLNTWVRRGLLTRYRVTPSSVYYDRAEFDRLARRETVAGE